MPVGFLHTPQVFDPAGSASSPAPAVALTEPLGRSSAGLASQVHAAVSSDRHFPVTCGSVSQEAAPSIRLLTRKTPLCIGHG
jgi:hypothetical protein